MSDPSISFFAKQVETLKIGEFVLNYIKKSSYTEITTTMEKTLKSLPADMQPVVVDMVDEVGPFAYKKEFWTDNCAKVFQFIADISAEQFRQENIAFTNSNLFDIYIIISLNYAGNAASDPKMTKFIKKSLGKGLFSGVFG